MSKIQTATSEWVDTHCHVTYEDIPGGADAALIAAREAGVKRMITIGTDLKTSKAAIELANANKDVWATVGLHPHDAKNGLDGLHELITHERVVAIGECGLDYYYEHSDRAVQREIFAAQIALAHQHKLPLVIHTREAWDETFEILTSCGVPEKTIFHCYSGDLAMAKICVDRGYILSFAGTLTFKNAPELREAVKIVPVDQLLVETDSPFLAPTPHRGALNTPAQIANIVRAMADERDVSDAELATALSNNAERIFGSFE